MGGFRTTGTAQWIEADWPAPAGVRALTTLRAGGCSEPPYASLNLAGHVGDRGEDVTENRRRIAALCALPSEPVWLKQAHGTQVIDGADPHADRRADGACTEEASVVCAVLTADCVPILLCDRAGTQVAALHGGWRGLAAGIIEAGLAAMRKPPDRLIAWLGPAISNAHYEIGDEIRTVFLGRHPQLGRTFTAAGPDHWLCDLYAIARHLLAQAGIGEVFGGDRCTYSEDCFYSFRRDGETGRMATLIWIQSEQSRR